MTFGERLATLRNAKNMTQDELAKTIQISKSTLGMYETNKREPDHKTTARLAHFFEISLDLLITGKPFNEKEEGPSILSKNVIKYIREAEATYKVDLYNDSLVREIIQQFIFNMAKMKAKGN